MIVYKEIDYSIPFQKTLFCYLFGILANFILKFLKDRIVRYDFLQRYVFSVMINQRIQKFFSYHRTEI